MDDLLSTGKTVCNGWSATLPTADTEQPATDGVPFPYSFVSNALSSDRLPEA